MQSWAITNKPKAGPYHNLGYCRVLRENSFKQLQTDYVDSVLIHGPRYDLEPLLAPGACLDVLLDWKARGRIGHLGIGVRQHELHQRAIETGAIDIVLSFLDYTLLDQSLAKTTIPLALEHDIGMALLHESRVRVLK